MLKAELKEVVQTEAGRAAARAAARVAAATAAVAKLAEVRLEARSGAG